MTSRSIEDLHPLLAYAFGKAEAEWLYRYPESPTPFLTCTYRDNAEQDNLFKQVPKVTNARAGESPHNYQPALAFDVAFKDKSGKTDYSTLLFERFAVLLLLTPGISWGGRFKSMPDRPHFELTDWKKRTGK